MAWKETTSPCFTFTLQTVWYNLLLWSPVPFTCTLKMETEIFLKHATRPHRATFHSSSLPSYSILNLLKPTGHVMHQQFNIQQLYALPTLYLCVLYLSESEQRLVPLTA